MSRLLVIGGGITGLAAAWQGVRSGAEVLLVESDERLGGKIHTERADGLLIEHGPDAFDKNPSAARELVDELGLSGQVIHPAPVARERVFIRRGSRLWPVPAGLGPVLPTLLAPMATTRILSPLNKLRVSVDLVLPRRLDSGDTTIGAFLRGRLGNGIVRRFIDPVVGGAYGVSVDELSLDAVLPSLRVQERRYRSLLLAAGHERPSTAAGATVPFVSLPDGMGSLVDALAEQLSTAGAEMRTGVSVIGVERQAGGSRVTLSDGTTHSADGVVFAGGAASSARLLQPFAPAAAAALTAVRLGSSTVVTVAYPLDAFPEPPLFHSWLEIQPAAVSAVTVSSTKWVGRAPSDLVLLRAIVPERVARNAELPDAALVRTVGVQLRRVLGITGDPVHQVVTRWSKAMPIYTVGHLDRVAASTAALAALPGWQLAGSALNGTGIADCIADGRLAATRALRPRLISDEPEDRHLDQENR